MNIPVLLLASVIVFWGWQIDQLLVGVILAIIMEGARLTKTRWDFSDHDQRRIADLCIYLMIGTLIYSLIGGKGSGRFFMVITWIPLLISPLALVQIYGNKNGLNLAALSLLARKKQAQRLQQNDNNYQRKYYDISYPYMALCLLSAGSANNRTPWFYIILFFLVAWAFWSKRNTRYPSSIFVGLFICAGVFGYIGQHWLQELQQLVEQKSMEWAGLDSQGDRDPFQANTAIGSLGTLKLSNNIVARVFTEKGMPPPDLLRNGSYNIFSRSKWYVSSKEVRAIAAGPDGKTWDIQKTVNKDRLLRYKIGIQLTTGEGLLAVPKGTNQLADLPVEEVEQGIFSAIRLSGAPLRLYPKVSVDPTADNDLPPMDSDLHIPDHMHMVLQSIISQNNLKRVNQSDTLKAIETYFNRNYTYSLVQDDPKSKKNGLEFFLTQSHAGHCEYFASATVLLLRMMGLPARYVTGWAVSEYSELEDCYLVRSRHAHAWGMVYINNHWQEIDTTPPNWLTLETEQSSPFRPISDFLSWCRYQITSWLDNDRPEIPTAAGWIVLALALYLGNKFLRMKRQVRETSEPAVLEPVSHKRGIKSDFYKIEHFLSENGTKRYPSETLSKWLNRTGQSHINEEQLHNLLSLLELHYKYRFDPQCDTDLCGRELQRLTQTWLAQAKLDRDKS
ncbi:MAG: transglutaminase-like domain-containing protein [Desulfobulbaceae bacterium]|nr:transglutaminase-like domain-containing protein [Desulfobulbaceae bacterium]